MNQDKDQGEENRYYRETLKGYGMGAELSVEIAEHGDHWVWSLQELEYDAEVERGTAPTYEEAIRDGKETWEALSQVLYEVMEDIRKGPWL
jgi:hypothetical protein